MVLFLCLILSAQWDFPERRVGLSKAHELYFEEKLLIWTILDMVLCTTATCNLFVLLWFDIF